MTRIRVLYADDDYLNRKVFQIKLQKRGIDCDAVEDGRSAVEMARRMRELIDNGFPYLAAETDGRLAFITLNRPEKLNALSNELRGELFHALKEAEADRSVGVIVLLGLPLAVWLVRRPREVNRITGPGFEVISPTERRRFIPLEERFQALDFLSKIETTGGLRLSANLNKVTLSVRKYGYLMEDKNYRNALLVNRRRVRRTLLRDGDVLDLGDLTLLYRDNRGTRIVRYASITPGEGKSQIKFQRLKGPIRRGIPMLVPEQTPTRIFYVTRNKIFIGRSENNDLVIKSRNVYYRHAKLERVGGRWKLQDLSILGNTFVNNRRIEQRFLKDGDEISIESHRFKFGFVTRAMRERPSHRASRSGPSV